MVPISVFLEDCEPRISKSLIVRSPHQLLWNEFENKF